MKKLNNSIEYIKLVIVLNLFLLGSIESEPPKSTLIFLLSTLLIAIATELILIKVRNDRNIKYRRYLRTLERAARDAIRDSDVA